MHRHPFQLHENSYIHLRELIRTHSAALSKYQARYKRKFDQRLRKFVHKPTVGGYAFLPRDYASKMKQGLRKLVLQADGP